MRDDQPSIAFLQSGLGNSAAKQDIHIERRNRVRNEIWKREDGQKRRLVSLEASQSTASSLKRKRSSTPIREKTEDENESQRKLQALSINPPTLITMSTCEQDAPSEPLDFDCHKVCTRAIAVTDNMGFTRADYEEHRKIITVENLICLGTSQLDYPSERFSINPHSKACWYCNTNTTLSRP